MGLSEPIDSRAWPLLHERLDITVAEAASRYLDQFVTWPVRVASRQ